MTPIERDEDATAASRRSPPRELDGSRTTTTQTATSSARPSGALDPEARLQHALDLALPRTSDRRDRTVAEVRAACSARKRVEPATIDAALGRAVRAGLPRRRALRARASPRTAGGSTAGARSGSSAGCSRVGVAGELIAAAVDDAGPGGRARGRDRAARAPLPDAARDARERERALGMLVRKGYELELAYDAIRRHAGAPAFD